MSTEATSTGGQIRILHVDDDQGLVDLTAELLENEDDRFDVVTETDPTAACDRVVEGEFDCIVSDYDMPGLNGVEFLERVREGNPDLPFILFTGKGSEDIASEAMSAGVTDYLQKGVGTDQYALLARQIDHAVERYRIEQELDLQYERLAEQRRVADTLRRINDRLARGTTRDDIETGVCEVLAESEPYSFAWVGEYDADTEKVHPRTSAGGGTDYLDTIEVTADETPTGQGPGGTAIRTREVAVTQDVASDTAFEQWRERALEREFAAVAGIPIIYEGTVYGLLAVYADRPYAFDEEEKDLLADLGETIGHAIHRVELTNTLRDPRQRYRNLLGAAPDAILVADSGGEIIEANASAGELWNCSREDLIGKHQAELHPTDERDRYRSLFERHMERQEPIDQFPNGSQVYISTADGERIPVEINSNTFELDGQIHVYGSFRDISGRLDDEYRLRAFADAFPDLAFLFDEDSRYLEVLSGPASEALLYNDADTLIGQTAREVLPTDVAEKFEAALQRTAETGTPETFEYSLTIEADHRWFQARTAPVERPENDDRAVVMVSRDITDRKQKEQEMARWERKYRTVFEKARDPILIADDDGEYLDANPAAEELFGLSHNELLGHSIDEFAAADYEFETAWQEFNQSDLNRGLFTLVRPDGTERIVEFNATPNVRPGRHMSILRDITDQHRVGQELTELVDRVTDGFYALDADCRFTYLNSRAEELLGQSEEGLRGETVWEAFPGATQGAFKKEYERAIDTQEPVVFEEYSETVGGWLEVRAYPSETGLSVYFRDISEEKRREQLLRNLHDISEELLQASTESEVAEYLVTAATDVLDLPNVAVLMLDDSDGVLQTAAMSDAVAEMATDSPTLEPGDNPIWNVYRTGEPELFDQLSPAALDDVIDEPIRQVIAVPISDFGVLLARQTETDGFDETTTDLAELLATNANAALDRLHHEQDAVEVTQRLADQQTRVQELTRLTESIHEIQERIAETETRAELEAAVCRQLATTESVAFAWLGHPQTTADDLTPEAWAGDHGGYLDAIPAAADGSPSLPAKQAARSRETVVISNIADRVYDGSWRKETISRGFQSVMSVPLVYDDVLYGVLSAYARQQSAFNGIVGDLLADLGPLLGSAINIRGQRHAGGTDRSIELEFSLSDPNCRFHQLAQGTDCTVRLDAITKPETETSVRILATVTEGEPNVALDAAAAMTSITDATYFGDSGGRQLALDVQKPCLALRVQEHGGRLRTLVADGDSTRVVIELPASANPRPLIDFLTSEYQDIDLVARREQASQFETDITAVTDRLTDRQYEILNAAYFGGYYETPKQITGEDLAENFDVSSPVVYRHLKAAERKVFHTLFDSIAETTMLDT